MVIGTVIGRRFRLRSPDAITFNYTRYVRLTLKSYLEANSQIEVVAVAEDGITALEKITELEPDIAIIDLEMPGMNGITTMEIINERFPHTKTLALSSHLDRKYINQARIAGAQGYLEKETSAEELNKAILEINQGFFQLDAKLSETTALNVCENLESGSHNDVEEANFFPTETENKEDLAVATSMALTDMRREIFEILEFKIHLLETKKNKINFDFQKLQRKFAWLLASQLVLLFLVIGSTSTALRLRQQSSTDVQPLNVVDTVQSVR